jgi:3-methyladenine DNA glycosylase AlkD
MVKAKMDFAGAWSAQRRNELIKYLMSLADAKYREFNKKIVRDETVEFIGVRAPELRKIAKQIGKNDYAGFVKFNKHEYFEETLLHGLSIGYAKLEFDELFCELRKFVPHISNWALADMTATKFPQILQNKDAAFSEISKFIKSKNPWEVRLGLIMLLQMYVDKDYILQVLNAAKLVNSNHPCCANGEIPYYVKIGNAWLISECYIKFPDVTEELFKSKVLEKWTHNKAIQKVCESFRVSDAAKEKLKKFKVK